ncbi:glycosyltransferase family 4 protein [Agromyces intestinalis]|uniref:Glycosyltransferase family 4 protein n=1 Tax=Agromyces intestinalis TaxID=2592652 RepID=A0A5C1YBZ9_9MICO|nr:glycosyltransferase family 4 protein [Agromyces intestinalis]QEO13551.1 glycosyltransferase family 4 protein [Agromyces intestinalis]
MSRPTTLDLWRRLPSWIRDPLAVAIARLRGERVPLPPEPDDRPVRLMIAPANYAGQGYRWARAVEQNPRVSAMNMVYDSINPFGYPVDYPVPGRIAGHSRTWQRAQLRALGERFTHMLIEAEMQPLGSLLGGDVLEQARAIQALGVRVAMLCHGSDIRLPSRHAAADPWSPFHNDEWVPVERLEQVVLGNLAVLEALDVPVFVSTPGLMLDVPDAHLLPVVIDVETWQRDEPVLERARPRVVHVPSNPLVKGTAEITPVLQELHDAGVIEYATISGVEHARMPELFGAADIVLDQFRLGDYGVAACEAMAAGRLVVSHVSDRTRADVEAETGQVLPIVEAGIASLREVLLEIVADPDRFRAIARSGPAFVREVHDGRMSRRVLEERFLFA